jgi:hypothetical protein
MFEVSCESLLRYSEEERKRWREMFQKFLEHLPFLCEEPQNFVKFSAVILLRFSRKRDRPVLNAIRKQLYLCLTFHLFAIIL